eukprot:2768684-Pyramimonas_sp.AAC.1
MDSSTSSATSSLSASMAACRWSTRTYRGHCVSVTLNSATSCNERPAYSRHAAENAHSDPLRPPQISSDRPSEPLGPPSDPPRILLGLPSKPPRSPFGPPLEDLQLALEQP